MKKNNKYNKIQISNNFLVEDEIKSSLKRILKFRNLPNNCIFFEPSENSQNDIMKNIFLNEKNRQLLHVIMFGSEDSVDNFYKIFGNNYLKNKLFTELCQEYYTYFPIPLNIDGIIDTLKSSVPRKNPFLNLKKIYQEFNGLFKDNSTYKSFIGNNIHDFFIRASENLLEKTDPKTKHIEYHGEAKEAPSLMKKFLFQIFDLTYANILHSKKCKQFNILWVDNNPERELSAIDDRFKEFIKPNIKLEGLLHKIENSFENYSFFIYDNQEDSNAFKKLREYLIAQDKHELFVRRPKKKIYAKIYIENFDFILIDILLGEEFNGIDLLELFTINFPEIPAFILSVSDESNTIASAIKEGADYYILKTQTLSIPYLYCQYLEKIGKIIAFLEK